MPLTEGDIARIVGRQVLDRKCVVLVDRCSWTGSECDVLAVTTDLRVIDVEIKTSRSDFKADRRKDKGWRRYGWQCGTPEPKPTPLEWPRRVWKHYFAMPAAIWTDDLAEFLPSPACGVLLIGDLSRSGRGMHVVRCKRRATPCRDADRLTPAQVMDVARLANLRMWDAYERRDRAAATLAERLAA